jgi:hypothetical protein
VLPELRAGPGIERDDLVERRAEEQLALDEDGVASNAAFLLSGVSGWSAPVRCVQAT